MASAPWTFTTELWQHTGTATWCFVSLPEPIADEIEAEHDHRARGFGSLRVDVTVGTTTWCTSIFPDSKRATYVLPVKKAVRAAEGLVPGSAVHVSLVVLP